MRKWCVIVVSCVLMVCLAVSAGAARMLRPGDVDGDGTVGNRDLSILWGEMAEGDISTDTVSGCWDVNGDGKVNLKDVALLQYYLAEGIEPPLQSPALSLDLQDYEVISTTISEENVVCTAFCYGTSVLGRDLVCWSIQQGEYSRTILLNFAIHGWEDAYAGDGQLLVELGNTLVEHYSQSADLQGCRLLIVPCANPDGVVDGTTNDGFGRCNADGIDLNRDFDASHVVYTNPRNYTSAPFSGVESRALRDLVWAAEPDVVIDFHGWLNYTIGSSDLAELFSLYVGLNHKYELGTGAHGYFSYWAQLQGAEAILVEFKDTDTVLAEDVIQALDCLIADNYGTKQKNHALDPDFAEFGSIVTYAPAHEKIYTQRRVGDMGTAYGYINGQSDPCTILQIYENGWCKVRYQVGSLTKTGYCELSSFIDPAMEVTHYSVQAGQTVTVYRTPDAAVKLGSAWGTDVLTVVAQQDGMLQVIFPLDSGGHKMGWIYASEIQTQ